MSDCRKNNTAPKNKVSIYAMQWGNGEIINACRTLATPNQLQAEIDDISLDIRKWGKQRKSDIIIFVSEKKTITYKWDTKDSHFYKA